MTIPTVTAAGRKASKVTKLALNRETLQELGESDAEAAGGQAFRPRQLTDRPDFCYLSQGLPCGWSWPVSCNKRCASSI
jgi:hypothetical protein